MLCSGIKSASAQSYENGVKLSLTFGKDGRLLKKVNGNQGSIDLRPAQVAVIF